MRRDDGRGHRREVGASVSSKILDRVRKILALKSGTHSEAEAAECAAQAAKLMAEYEITEAMLRLDEPSSQPEKIVREPLEDVAEDQGVKRVAWKSVLHHAIADDLGIHTYLSYSNKLIGSKYVKQTKVMGIGRESAIQTWKYTFQFLCREINKLADEEWQRGAAQFYGNLNIKAFKNSFRLGAAGRVALKIAESSQVRRADRAAAIKAAGIDSRESRALLVVEREQAEVDAEYESVKRGFDKPAAAAIGRISSYSGYHAGVEAGEKIVIGSKKAALTAPKK